MHQMAITLISQKANADQYSSIWGKTADMLCFKYSQDASHVPVSEQAVHTKLLQHAA